MTNINYDTAYVIRNASRRFLKSTSSNSWGGIGDSQLFDNYYAAREVASRIPGARVRHLMLKPIRKR